MKSEQWLAFDSQLPTVDIDGRAGRIDSRMLSEFNS